MTDSQSQRAYCYRCFKPAVVCVCGGAVVANRTRVVIVQHPREVHHPLGTERIARLGLSRCSVQVAWNCVVERSCVPPGAALLYPSEHAVEIGDLDPSARPSALVAIDGTWSQARSLYRDNAWLAELPHVKLTRAPPSNYRIRREPRAHYVSTLEAVVHALRALEPDTPGFDALLQRFAAMIDQQIAFTERPPAGSYRHGRKSPRALRPDPRLIDPAGDVVVGYVEYIAYNEDGVEREAITQVCLDRLRDNTHVEILVRPDRLDLVTDERLAHMRLTRAQLEGGVAQSQVAAAVSAFVRPSDVFAAWSTPTLYRLTPLSGGNEGVALKTAYGNFTRTRPGQMESIIAYHRIQGVTQLHSGRAGERQAWAVAIARWLCKP